MQKEGRIRFFYIQALAENGRRRKHTAFCVRTEDL